MAKVRPHDQYVSTLPPERPPDLTCPYCDVVLVYDRSHVDGGRQARVEQRDYFVCATHGTFEYRHRTRKLRSAS